MMPTLREARDEAWAALGQSRWRRSLLGRDRADRLVRLALDTSNEGEQRMAAAESFSAQAMRRIMAERVRDSYSEKCSGIFTTLILSWAISTILNALIQRWWSKPT